MGILFSRLKRKKDRVEILENLDNRIKSIVEFSRSTQKQQKELIGRLVIASFTLYLFVALVCYFYFFPNTLERCMLLLFVLVLLPILTMCLKSMLTWYYRRKIVKNERILKTLKEDKQKILEEIMTKETYQVAKPILERFGLENLDRMNTLKPNDSIARIGELSQNVKSERLVVKPSNDTVTPFTLRRRTMSQIETPDRNNTIMRETLAFPTPIRPLPGILPQRRTVLDKLVDYLLNEGPSNRYALVCKKCFSHNGLTLKDEFEYTSFKCYYCNTYNAAKKQKPISESVDDSSATIVPDAKVNEIKTPEQN